MASKIILRRVNRVYSIHYWRYSALKLKKKIIIFTNKTWGARNTNISRGMRK